MTDRSRRRAAPSDTTSREDNPFAAPPEGQPDQPWHPRRGADQHGSGTGTDTSGSERPDGSEGSGDDSGSGSGSDKKRSVWGSQWSSRQPGRQSGGFGGPSSSSGNGQGNGNSGNGNGTGSSSRGGMRWDPTDPLQRHARYSLHTGIWALFFSLFSLPEVALLLGALSLYWGINSLRGDKSPSRTESSGKRGSGSGAAATAEDVAGSDRTTETGEKPPPAPSIPVSVTPAQAAKSRTTAAVSGLITAALALAVVAATFTFQSVYREYFTCTQDALTQSSREDCKGLLPSELRPLLENR